MTASESIKFIKDNFISTMQNHQNVTIAEGYAALESINIILNKTTEMYEALKLIIDYDIDWQTDIRLHQDYKTYLKFYKCGLEPNKPPLDEYQWEFLKNIEEILNDYSKRI